MFQLPGFEIKSLIHESQHAFIYEALQAEGRREVVIKILKKEYPASGEILGFKQEYELTKHLDNPAIRKIYGYRYTGGKHLLVMEKFTGLPLNVLLQKGPLPVRLALQYASLIAAALGEVHRCGLIHKDIKPHNILLDEASMCVKIIDFGISGKIGIQKSGDAPENLQGTLAYISPEQTGRMNRSVDYRSDYYSLGVVFYEMLTGLLPFPSSDPMETVHCHIAKTPESPFALSLTDKLPSKIPPIPKSVSAIAMKLMGKTAEDRYQSPAGLLADLRACLANLEAGKTDENFEPGQEDFSGIFNLSQKLYGRAEPFAKLLAAFERAAKGSAELTIVSGQPGEGKSSLVNELQKTVAAKRGFFIKGKYEAFNKSIPYSAFGQAFALLAEGLLKENEASLALWKIELQDALGLNGKIITDLLPVFEEIIGPQPPLATLEPSEAQSRFIAVLLKFIKVFAQKTHPLTVFLDDIHHADRASLALLQIMLTELDLRYIHVIAASKPGWATGMSSFSALSKKAAEAGTGIEIIELNPLFPQDIALLLADSLRGKNTLPLAQLDRLAVIISQKTLGNPFFINHFLKTIHEEGLLRFDFTSGGWEWEEEAIQKHLVTDNVAGLMSEKTANLSPEKKSLLYTAACIGSKFGLKMLRKTAGGEAAAIKPLLLEMLEDGLLTPLDSNYQLFQSDEDNENIEACYAFSHDKLHEAAYSMLDENEARQKHLAIGRGMLEGSTETELEEHLFECAGHLMQGAEILPEGDEKTSYIRLGLKAALKAKKSSAYSSAEIYLDACLGLLGGNGWQKHRDLTFELHANMVEAAFQNQNEEKMAAFSKEAIAKSKNLAELFPIYSVLIISNIQRGKLAEAVEAGLDFLKISDISFPKKPGKLHILLSLLRTKAVLAGKTIEDFKKLPDIKDPRLAAASMIMARIGPATFFTEPNLLALLAFRHLRFTLQHGNTEGALAAYLMYAMILCGKLEQYKQGYEFGMMGKHIVEKYGLTHLMPTFTAPFYAFIHHWTRPLKEGIPQLEQNSQTAADYGDWEYFGNNALVYLNHLLVEGQSTDGLLEETVKYKSEMLKHKLLKVIRNTDIIHQFCINLHSDNDADPSSLTGSVFDEKTQVPELIALNDKSALGTYYTLKYFLHYLHGDAKYVVKTEKEIDVLMEARKSTSQFPLYFCIKTLAYLDVYLKDGTQKDLLKKASKNIDKMKAWKDLCPANISHLYYLAVAEYKYATGNDFKAQRYYFKSINAALESNCLYIAALANERAALFYLNRKIERYATMHFTDASYYYKIWGADRKARDLEKQFPRFIEASQKAQSTGSGRAAATYTISTGHENTSMLTSRNTESTLDIGTVVKASQVLSGEVHIGPLLKSMMRIVIESAGADKGIIVQNDEGEFTLQCELGTSLKEPVVLQNIPVEESGQLPKSMIYYVGRTRKILVLNDVMKEGGYSDDEYIKTARPKSVLCMPIIRNDALVSIIYLENSLSENAFTPKRLEVLQMLSSQMGISIENALLYKNLEGKVQARTKEVMKKNDQLEQQKAVIENKNKHIMDSIRYGERIQQAILPDNVELSAKFNDIFVLHQPKDVVSGDFYWYAHKADKTYIAVVDCTGHGVPGAFMSMIGNTILNEIVNELSPETPGIILDELHLRIRRALHQQDNKNDDGMDVCLCMFRENSTQLLYAGAKRPLLYCRDGQIGELKGTKKSIGGAQKEADRKFDNETFELKKGDLIYLSSDGYIDQNNPERVKFGSLKFKEMLSQNAHLPMEEQKTLLADTMKAYMRDEEQRDDITVIGVRV